MKLPDSNKERKQSCWQLADQFNIEKIAVAKIVKNESSIREKKHTSQDKKVTAICKKHYMVVLYIYSTQTSSHNFFIYTYTEHICKYVHRYINLYATSKIYILCV